MALLKVSVLFRLAAAWAALEDAHACPGSDPGEVAQCLEERVPARGPLLLQVGRSHMRREGLGDVCNADSPEFSAALCHKLSLGVSEPRELLQPASRAPDLGLLSEGSVACGKTFHALSLDETEKLQPGLKSCLVSTWAAKIHQSLSAAPCARTSPSDADVVVLPGYTATECNWPIYGGGVCINRKDGLANFAREGEVCRGEDTLQAYRQIQAALGKPVVVLENSPDPQGHKYDLPDPSIYAEPNISWALVGSDTNHYRLGADVSLPPGPSLRCRLSVPSSRSAKSFLEPLESKAHLASFKGSFSMHVIRPLAREILHDGKDFVISDASDWDYDFDDLLFSSVFSLILRGDAIMTTRINEAVCSGGIPVLITDSWVPPFNETVPFTTYGLIHDENQLQSLRERLEQVSSSERAKLRKEAKKACMDSFQTIEAHAAALAQALSGLAKVATVTR